MAGEEKQSWSLKATTVVSGYCVHEDFLSTKAWCWDKEEDLELVEVSDSIPTTMRSFDE